MIWTTEKPPIAGVFVASTERNADARRYWNGRRWSAPWYRTDPADVIEWARCTPARTEGDVIEWATDAAR